MADYLTAEERAARAVRVRTGITRFLVMLGDKNVLADASLDNAERIVDVLRPALAALLREHEAGLVAHAMSGGPGEPPVTANDESHWRELQMGWLTPENQERMRRDLLALLDHARKERDHALTRLALLYRDENVNRAEIDRAKREGYRKGRAACVEAAASKAEDLWYDNKPAGLAVLTAVETVPEEMP